MVIFVTANSAELIALKYLTTFIFQSALSPFTNDPIPNTFFPLSLSPSRFYMMII